MEIYNWIVEHWDDIALIITGIISVSSLIVKLTPTLKDDTFLLKVIKFLSKVGLNRTVNDNEIRANGGQ